MTEKQYLSLEFYSTIRVNYFIDINITKRSRTTGVCFLCSKPLMIKIRNLGLKESVRVKYKDGICV